MSKFAANRVLNNVVALNGQARERSSGYRILSECRELLVDSLCVWLGSIAAAVTEELLLLADSSRERLQQKRYSDLRADIKEDWSPLVDTFRRDLSAEAERCQNLGNAQNRQEPLEIPDFEGLQLLDDEDLSEHIVIREFSAQLAESCDAELYTLNRRVAALLGLDELSDSANPLAPAVVCRALSGACATIGSDAEGRLLLLRRLERHLHLVLPQIYKQINALLIERNILPDLKRNFGRDSAGGELNASGYRYTGAGAGSRLGRAGREASRSEGGPGGSGNAAAMSGEGILEALQRLAQARSGALPAGAPAAMGTFAVPGIPAVGFQGVALDTASLNQFLQASLQEMQKAPVTGNAAGPIINQVRMVRDSENAQQVSGLASVTLDIVAMLFDFIFDDVHIPVAVKALISRLQIPVLKVAMLNPGFFADRQHPTRRFLGGVAGVSIRWGGSVDETDSFFCKLSELVERIQTGFESDVEVFGAALAELEAFVDEREGEEDDTAMTAANIVIQREQEVESWERAQGAVKDFSAKASLPLLIDAFLREHWVGVLQAIAVRNDADSSDWDAANKVMTDLAWSVEAKQSQDDRLRLISLLPGMLAQINKGLDGIVADADQRDAFFDALVHCHSAALKGGIQAEAPPSPAPSPLAEHPDPSPPLPPAPPEEGDLLVMRSVDNGIAVEEIILVGASPIWRADDREISRLVSELTRGDWVEFRESAEQNEEETISYRERLRWISPQRGILLFSNHRSAKAISITPEALARQIRDGNANILQREEIFERALTGAMESLSAG